jgi:surfactin synthase thioesterase subunit
MRLFCIPYAGSGASAYRGWAENAPGLDVCYVQLPGRENRLREKPFTSIPTLIEALGAELETWTGRPYALYGHSLGGIVAFELARALRARGLREPEHLFVSASRAPHLPCPHPAMHQLPDLELLEEVQRRYDSVPAPLMTDPELRELLVPCLRADLALLETYQHSPAAPLGCGITCFSASRDRMVSRDAVEPWRTHTQKQFQLHQIEADHLFLQSARDTLLATVEATLQADPLQASRGPVPEYQGDNGISAL